MSYGCDNFSYFSRRSAKSKYSSRIRSYVEFEGNVENMHIEINTGLRSLALVAPIRLNATRELLDRVQGHIPEDYYSRFDRYRKGWAHHNLVDEAEKGPICANEFGFTKALANCNDFERHYYADQNYHNAIVNNTTTIN